MEKQPSKKPVRKPKPRPKKYLCTEPNCDKAYSRPCLLEQHLRSHADERPFVCTALGCGKAFLRDSHLKTHMLSHSIEKPLYCSYCGKGFNTNQHLNRHERTHVPSIKCTYEGCTAAFRRNSQLRKHVAECHTFRKQFACPSCPKEFDVKSRLDAHLEKCHQGSANVTPAPPIVVSNNIYHCGSEGCVEKFETWTDLQNHIKYTHKRHGCNLCGRVFPSIESLEIHGKEHELEHSTLLAQEWHCREPQCENLVPCFHEKNELISHYQQHHGFVPETLQVQVHTPVTADCLPPLSSITEQHQQLHKQQHQQHQQHQQQHLPQLPYQSQPPQQQQLPTSRDPLYKGPSIIDRITGAGYDTNRRIECPVEGCGYRFAREYDMKRHAKAVHPHVSIDELIAISKPSSETHSGSGADGQFNAGMPKFKFYVSPSNMTPRSDLSPAPNHPNSSSASPAPFMKNDEIDISNTLDQQQSLPSLSHYQQQHHQQQQQHQHHLQQHQQLQHPHPLQHPLQHSHLHQNGHQHTALPSFDPALNMVSQNSPGGGFEFLPHEMSLNGFSQVPLSQDILHETSASNNTSTTDNSMTAGNNHTTSVHSGSSTPSHFPQHQHQQHGYPQHSSTLAQQQLQQRGDFERIDPIIVNGSV